MLTETITWHEAGERLPDAELAVLVRTDPAEDGEPVWIGWFDGDSTWHDTEGGEIKVIRWAEFPTGDPA